MTQQLMFMKNIGIVGGLLAFYAFGAGRISIDKQIAGRDRGRREGDGPLPPIRRRYSVH